MAQLWHKGCKCWNVFGVQVYDGGALQVELGPRHEDLVSGIQEDIIAYVWKAGAGVIDAGGYFDRNAGCVAVGSAC